MDLKEIQDFIKAIARSGISEVKIETEELKLSIKTQPKERSSLPTETSFVQGYQMQPHLVTTPPIQMMTGFQTTSPVNLSKETELKQEDTAKKMLEIKSPMVGTFYKRPAPDKAAYVNIGDDIEAGQVVCVIEAMKLFNEIESEISGKLVKILVDDSSPVEFDQVLYLLEPK
jgi:acetyl-CoA carboxylase biotin carboxyl carrier protein